MYTGLAQGLTEEAIKVLLEGKKKEKNVKLLEHLQLLFQELIHQVADQFQ